MNRFGCLSRIKLARPIIQKNNISFTSNLYKRKSNNPSFSKIRKDVKSMGPRATISKVWKGVKRDGRKATVGFALAIFWLDIPLVVSIAWLVDNFFEHLVSVIPEEDKQEALTWLKKVLAFLKVGPEFIDKLSVRKTLTFVFAFFVSRFFYCAPGMTLILKLFLSLGMATFATTHFIPTIILLASMYLFSFYCADSFFEIRSSH